MQKAYDRPMSDDMTYVKLFTSLHYCGSMYMIQIRRFRDLSSLLIIQADHGK